jgi:hypothetical protein
MANATNNISTPAVGGPGPFKFHLPMAAATRIFEGTFVSQIIASGYAVPYSTALSSHAVGVATAQADNSTGLAGDKRVQVESKRMFEFANGAGGDAFSEASLIGSKVYATDDHTVAGNDGGGARKCVGVFFGMQEGGKVRVFVDPSIGAL